MESGTENHGNNLISWKILMKSLMVQIIDVSINRYGVKFGTSLRFWKKNRWINEIDPYGWF